MSSQCFSLKDAKKLLQSKNLSDGEKILEILLGPPSLEQNYMYAAIHQFLRNHVRYFMHNHSSKRGDLYDEHMDIVQAFFVSKYWQRCLSKFCASKGSFANFVFKGFRLHFLTYVGKCEKSPSALSKFKAADSAYKEKGYEETAELLAYENDPCSAPAGYNQLSLRDVMNRLWGELAHEVEKAIQCLPDKYREALYAKHTSVVKSNIYGDMHTRYKVREGTIRAWANRAEERVRKALEPHLKREFRWLSLPEEDLRGMQEKVFLEHTCSYLIKRSLGV
jgi:DNA-directed RNA polymerase specialized sigma24 family protein